MKPLSHRAERLLAMIRDPLSAAYAESRYDLDGEWMRLVPIGRIIPHGIRHGIGLKTCAELVAAGILIECPHGSWSACGRHWYRLAMSPEEFADLWGGA